jgi:hypothetical protein
VHKDERFFFFRKGAGNNLCLSVSLNYVTRVCYRKRLNSMCIGSVNQSVFEHRHEPHFLGWIVSSNLAEFVVLMGRITLCTVGAKAYPCFFILRANICVDVKCEMSHLLEYVAVSVSIALRS